jgi:hypothetical protein
MLFSFLTPFFWLVIFIVIIQYRRTAAIEKKMFGQPVNNVAKQTLHSVLFGIVGGFFGSFFLLLMGISLDNIGIAYLWPLAIILFLINPRFLCFAYAGGILALSSLLLRALQPFQPALAEVPLLAGLLEIHLPGLLALVSILHLTEAFLILISGHYGASPIYFKDQAGRIVGGFSMQRFWPMPLTGLWALVVAETSEMFVGGIAMPEWWPLLGTVMDVGGGEKVVYLMVPLVAGLGYGDLALNNHPREKRVKTAFHLAIYSLLLSVAAVASVYYPPAILAAALIAPFGHEFLIKMGNAAELAAPSIFRSDRDGLQVMAVIPGSTAQRAGLRAGDRLLALNGYRLHSEPELRQLLSLARGGPTFARISRGNEGKGDNGSNRELVLPLAPVATGPEQAPYGLIFSPGPDTAVYVELKHSSLLHKWRRRRQEG